MRRWGVEVGCGAGGGGGLEGRGGRRLRQTGAGSGAMKGGEERGAERKEKGCVFVRRRALEWVG
jgi:hypothetical protein